MTADEYVPDEEQVRAWCREGTGDYPDVMDEWLDQFLARVRRDAAREVLEGLVKHFEEVDYDQEADDVRAYIDAHYPEEAP